MNYDIVIAVYYSLYTANKATFAFHKVVQRHYSGEVGEFTIFLCEISSRFCSPKIINIGSFSPSYSKFKGSGVFETA